MAKAVTPLNAVNKNSNFRPADVQLWELRLLPIAASSAIEEGSAMSTEVSGSSPTGNLIKAAATNANGQNIQGILAEPIASTDSDYATAGKLKMVYVPKTTSAIAEFTVGAGTFTAADVGRMCNIHTDSKSLAVDTNGVGAIIRGYISSTRGTCSFDANKVVTA